MVGTYGGMRWIVTLISNNGVSKVWADGDWIFKRQPKTLTDNEIYALERLVHYGYVPYAEQVEIELVRIERVRKQNVTNPKEFLKHIDLVLAVFKEAEIRHGDLTKPHILPVDNRPIIVDWGESRAMCDPRPDKRREGDEYWLKKSMNEIVKMSQW
jgi:tRNA A-37 threonylcarbamoyl transferase component Bud32